MPSLLGYFSDMRHNLSFLFLILILAGCNPKPPQTSAPNVLAFVNGQVIFEKELAYRIDLEKIKFSDKAMEEKKSFDELKHRVLNEMIENKAISDWGKKNNILLTPEEIAAGIQATKKGYTDKAFENFLTEKGIPFNQWRSLAEERLLVRKIIQQEVYSKVEVPPKVVKDYYSSHLSEFKIQESVRARHIVTDSEEKAKKIMTLLQQGENFTKVAILHSLSPDRANGGDLGYFERGTHPLIFDETCFSLKNGELSPIVKSSYGYHIFKLIGKKPARTKKLEEAFTEIYSKLIKIKMTDAYQIWLDSVLKESQIQVIEDNIKKMKFENIL